MNEEDLKKQALQFRELVGDELFWFTVSQNVMTMERGRLKFEQLALAILEYFEYFKALARKYGKKDLKVEWEEGVSEAPLHDHNGSAVKKAVYVALPIPVQGKFLKYLHAEKG